MRKAAYSASTAHLKDRSSMGFARKMARGQGIVLLPTSAELVPLCEAAVRALPNHWGGAVDKLDVLDLLIGRVPDSAPFGKLEEIRLANVAYHDCADYAVRVVFTERRLEDNWFSHWYAAQQTAVATLHGWKEISAVSPVAYAAQEILLHGLNALSPRYDMQRLAHEETRGCLFDFCGDKRDAEVKLQTMDVCPSCRQQLVSMHVDPEFVLGLCSIIRDIATGRKAA